MSDLIATLHSALLVGLLINGLVTSEGDRYE